MEYICIGKIVQTHGIKGELRIRSNFDKKDLGDINHKDIINLFIVYIIIVSDTNCMLIKYFISSISILS